MSVAFYSPKGNLKRGQLKTSIPEIQEACSWSVGYRKEVPSKSKIFRIIEWLRRTSEQNDEQKANVTMIETTNATQGIVITITNYSHYQDPENYERNAERTDEEATNGTRTERHRNNKKKKVKKENKEKNLNTLNTSCSDSPPNTENEQPKFQPGSNPYEAARYLRGKILENNKRAEVPDENPKALEVWAEDMDKLNRLGPVGARKVEGKGYRWSEIGSIIDWCQADSFWKDNILSASKLRKQVTQLENKMKSGNRKYNKQQREDDLLREIYDEAEG